MTDLLNNDFKIRLHMHMLKELKEGIEKVKKTTHKPHRNTSINEKTGNLKRNHPQKFRSLKSTITEIKSLLQGFKTY